MAKVIAKVEQPKKGLRIVYKEVIKKSQAGIEYTHYVPVIEGEASFTGMNHADRRRQAAIERSAKYRAAMADEARRLAKKRNKHESELLKKSLEAVEKQGVKK